MAFASGGFHGLRYVRENTFGVTPPNPEMRNLRHTSCSLVLSKDSFQSQELRSDAQISDLRHGNKRAQGDVGFEFSFGEFDTFLAAALRSRWQNDSVAGRQFLVAGIDMSSFTLERVFADISQYEIFTGCEVDTFALTMQTNGMTTGTISFVGKDVNFSNTSLDAEPDVSLAAAPFDGFSGELFEAQTRIAVVTSIELNIANGLEPAFVIGSNAAAGIIPGRINVTGTISAYFENMDLLRKFVNEEESSLQITIGDGEKQSYIITLPRIKYSGGDNPVDGEGAITLSMPFQALYDSCTNTNIRIEKIQGPEPTPCALTYSATSMSPAEDGEYAPITITLAGGDGTKVFNGVIDGEIPGVTITGVPDGAEAKVVKKDSTSAILTLDAQDNASITAGSLNLSFAASSFAFGFCHCPGQSVQDISKVITINAAG